MKHPRTHTHTHTHTHTLYDWIYIYIYIYIYMGLKDFFDLPGQADKNETILGDSLPREYTWFLKLLHFTDPIDKKR